MQYISGISFFAKVVPCQTHRYLRAIPNSRLSQGSCFQMWSKSSSFALSLSQALRLPLSKTRIYVCERAEDRRSWIPISAAQPHMLSDPYKAWVVECKILRQREKKRKTMGKQLESCQHAESLASNQHWTFDIIYVLYLGLVPAHTISKSWIMKVNFQRLKCLLRRNFTEFNPITVQT